MCFNAANVFDGHPASDLNLEAIGKMAQSLYPLPQLLLSGGEPFLRSDISEIISSFYSSAGTRQFSIPTNGTQPKRIVSACEATLSSYPDIVLNINLSLDHVGEEHNRLRGLSGCYERVCETYAQLDGLRVKYAGLSVNISTIITEHTVECADDIIAGIRARFKPNYHAIGILRSNYAAPVPEAFLHTLAGKIDLDVLEKRSFNALPLLGRVVSAVGSIMKKRYVKSLRERRRCFTCLAGKKIIVVTADGRLMPCEPLWLEEGVRQCTNENRYLMAHLEEYDYDVRSALASERAKSVKSYVTEKKCWCSYVCAIQNGIFYSPRAYPLILLEMLRR